MPAACKRTLLKMQNVGGRPCAVVRTVWQPSLKDATADLLRTVKASGKVIPKGDIATVQAYRSESIEYIDPSLLYTLKSTETLARRLLRTSNGVRAEKRFIQTNTVSTETISAK
jgi:hypothetical protein